MSFRIGRRAPLAVLTLISGLSSISLAITLLGTGLIIQGILKSNHFLCKKDIHGWKLFSHFLRVVVFEYVIVF